MKETIEEHVIIASNRSQAGGKILKFIILEESKENAVYSNSYVFWKNLENQP